jgi:deoxyribonuclease V
VAAQVDLYGDLSDPRLIAAVDSAHGQGGHVLYAAAVVVTFPDLVEVERAFYYSELEFPYTPGLLYFREGPAVIGALAKLKSEPDLIVVHGHGIAHPQRCGLACYVGVAFDRPTMGCARRLLAGRHAPVAPTKGSFEKIIIDDRQVGVAQRTKDDVKPVFISPGYRCDIAQAQDIIVRGLRGFRLPEPLRLAHLLANKYKRRAEKKEKRHRPQQFESV